MPGKPAEPARSEPQRTLFHLGAPRAGAAGAQLALQKIYTKDVSFEIPNAPQVFQAYKSICEQDGEKRVEEHRAIFDALVERDAEAARNAMHEHFGRILQKLISTAEAEQLEQIRRQSEEVRKRFSLGQSVASHGDVAVAVALLRFAVAWPSSRLASR